jgi:hypothetical protein
MVSGHSSRGMPSYYTEDIKLIPPDHPYAPFAPVAASDIVRSLAYFPRNQARRGATCSPLPRAYPKAHYILLAHFRLDHPRRSTPHRRSRWRQGCKHTGRTAGCSRQISHAADYFSFPSKIFRIPIWRFSGRDLRICLWRDDEWWE